jgi:hypothetical protein
MKAIATIVAVSFLFGVFLLVGSAAAQDKEPAAPKVEVTLVDDQNNLISQEIWGAWTQNEEATKFAGGRGSKDSGVWTFSKDKECSDRFQEEAARCVEQMKEREKGYKNQSSPAWEQCLRSVYACGKLEAREGENERDLLDFGIANLHGNQVLIVLLPDKGAGAGYRLRSFNIAFVRDPKGDKDLLWLGGTGPNEPFACNCRVPK